METLLIILDKFKMYNVDVIDPEGFLELVLRFTLNTVVLLLLVRWIYYSTSRRKDYLFTYILIGSIVFLLCYLLANVKLQLGFALGLFAIFGIMRFRTSQMPIKEMTYLFLVIALSVINALANKKVGLAEIIFTNITIILITYGFEKRWLLTHESVKNIIYEKIDLIKPEKYAELIADLQMRTGISNIKRAEVGKIDFLRDICRVKIYYEETTLQINMADNESRESNNGDDD
jgi:hypothetical protein